MGTCQVSKYLPVRFTAFMQQLCMSQQGERLPLMPGPHYYAWKQTARRLKDAASAQNAHGSAPDTPSAAQVQHV